MPRHPDYELWINRQRPIGEQAGCRFTAQPGQIKGGIDHAHQMIARNSLAKVKLVRQLTLIALQPSNHGGRSLMFS
jgi:hypothetical protein